MSGRRAHWHLRQFGLVAALLVAALPVLAAKATKPEFGPNVMIFDPSMSSQSIQKQIDAVYATQQHDEFGPRRHALLKQAEWDTDPGVHPGTLKTGVWQHIAFVVDGGPKIITAIVDGILNDGGPARDYGWGRFPADLSDINGKPEILSGAQIFGNMKSLRIYNRYLRISEVVGNYRSEKP